MPDFLIRNLPDDLWRKFKAKAALEGETMRAVVIQLLTDYVEGGRPKGSGRKGER